MSSYIPTISFTLFLPEELGDTGEMDAHAKDLQTHGETAEDTYTDTNSTYTGLGAHVEFPGDQDLIGAFEVNCAALKETLAEGLDRIGDAVIAFSSSVSGFKSTHSTLKTDVEDFNVLHPFEYTTAERERAAEEGRTLPDPTRTSAARSALISRLTTAKETYEGYIDTCVDSIKAASPASMPADKPFALEKVEQLKKAYDQTVTWVGRAGNIRDHNGRLGFLWEFDEASLSNFVKEGVPGWMKVHDKDSWLGKALPQHIKDRIPNVDKMGTTTFWKNADDRYRDFLDGMESRGSHHWRQVISRLPVGAQEWLSKSSTRTGEFLHSNFVLDKASGKYIAATTLMTKKLPSLPAGALKRIDGLKLDDRLKALDKSRAGSALKHGGKALGVVGAGYSYYGAYTEGYNEALADNPHASEQELRTEGIKTAAIEGSFETGGAVVGGVVGRAAGAAVGQALIPIPGVGAAIGGVAGGFVGDWVGGKVGKGVGNFANEVRKEGFGGAIKGLFGG